MRSSRPGRAPLLALLAAAALALVLAACSSSSRAGGPYTLTPIATFGTGAYASATADLATAADINQAKALVGKCITGTPLQQLRTLHLLLFESKTGPHGAEVEQTRKTVFECMGVPASQRDALVNAALTAAEQGHLGKPGHLAIYFEVRLPGLVAQAQKGTLTASGTASPAAAGAPASPAPSTRTTTPAARAAS